MSEKKSLAMEYAEEVAEVAAFLQRRFLNIGDSERLSMAYQIVRDVERLSALAATPTYFATDSGVAQVPEA
jgi:hypothetical protein